MTHTRGNGHGCKIDSSATASDHGSEFFCPYYYPALPYTVTVLRVYMEIHVFSTLAYENMKEVTHPTIT